MRLGVEIPFEGSSNDVMSSRLPEQCRACLPQCCRVWVAGGSENSKAASSLDQLDSLTFVELT
jgi:hypothetical protein